MDRCAMIDELRSLFISVAEELPSGCARMNEFQSGDATNIELIPSAPGAARVGVYVDQSELIDFWFGSGCTWELPSEGRDPRNFDPQAMIAEASEMLAAVVSGQCEEKRWLLGTTGIIYLSGQPHRVTDVFTRPTLFPRTIHYRPYVPEALQP